MESNRLALFALALTLVSCGEQIPYPLSELPLPPGAYDVQAASVGVNHPNQLLFKVDIEYPSKSVLDLYSGHFQSTAWTKCRGTVDDWQQMIDATKRPRRMVHRTVHYWMNKDRETMASVALYYYSPYRGNHDHDPVSDTQHVTVGLYEHPDVGWWLQEKMRVRCPHGEGEV